MRGWCVLGGIAALGAAIGCGAKSGAAPVVRAPAKAEVSACARTTPGMTVAPYAAPMANGKVDRVREGSQVVLAKRGASTLAYVADEDDGTIHVVDLSTMLELLTFDAGGSPAQMMMLPDGRLLVTLRDRAQVKVFEPTGSATGAMSERCALDTELEPIGLALSPDDGTVLVSSGWGHALTAFDAADLGRKFRADLPREPRAVVVSDDGAKAFVSHAVGSAMSVVDLRDEAHAVRTIPLKGKEASPSRKHRLPIFESISKSAAIRRPLPTPDLEPQDRTSCQGFALAKTVVPDGRILAPQVLVESGDTSARTSGYGSVGGQASELPGVAVIDQDSNEPLAASLLVRDERAFRAKPERECLLPRAAAVHPVHGSLLVTCVGSNVVVEYDAAAAEPHAAELRTWRVASGPTGIAVDWAAERAVVWSQFGRTLNVVALGDTVRDGAPAEAKDDDEADAPVTRIALSRRPAMPKTADVALGRELFHAVGDRRISMDGRACASCHPDGRDDAITWATPDGPRQTPVLAGRLAGTAPYAWSGSGQSVKEHLTHTFQRLRGTGLGEHEVESLVAYVNGMATPPSRTTMAAEERAQIERGSRIFHSDAAACATCHGKGGAEPDGLKHDVESRAPSDMQAEFDTPSLRFVGGSAPYFHDGRYPTMRALLVASDGKMGNVAHLSPADLDALEAYVRTL